MINSWLKFFQSHDHMIYSKRGPLWADLVWKSALLHKCEILEDLYQRLVPEKGDRLETSFQYMWSHATMWHSTIPSAVRAWFDTHSRMMSLSLALTPLSSTTLRSFSQPGDGRFLTIVHRTKCPSRMQWMLNAKTSQLNNTRKDKAYQRFFPRCLAREDIRCDLDENMWPNAEDQAD